jgi:hypothetical protein
MGFLLKKIEEGCNGNGFLHKGRAEEGHGNGIPSHSKRRKREDMKEGGEGRL